jgi:hypothetical protein
MHDSIIANDWRKAVRRQRLRPAAGVAGLIATGLVMAACSSGGSSGPQVAHISSSASASASTSSGATKPSALAFSRCMRAHGVTKFPDPDANGHITLPGQGTGAQSPKMAAARKACDPLLPPEQKTRNAPDRASSLKYAKCMRAHGVTNFPDPSADGGIVLDPSVVNPSSPQFKSAQQACKSLMPGGGGGQGGS